MFTRNITAVAGALGLALFAGACAGQARHEAPDALHVAIGAAPVVGADDPGRSTGELLTYDLEPFYRAGMPEPTTTVSGLIRTVVGDASWEAPWLLHTQGRHLIVRHEPQVIALVRKLLAHLERERLRPVRLDLHLVEVAADKLAPWKGALAPDATVDEVLLTSIRNALASGDARSLARRRLHLTAGQWGGATDRRSRRPVVGVTVENGRPIQVQQTAEDGLALQAAVWPSETGDAVVHLEAALQVEADPGARRTATVAFHPDPKDRSVTVDASLELPTLRTTALRGQVTIAPRAWHLAARAPAPDPARIVLALVRADWVEAEELQLARIVGDDARRVIEAIRVALPERLAVYIDDIEVNQTGVIPVIWGKGVNALAIPMEEASRSFAAEERRQKAVASSISNFQSQQLAPEIHSVPQLKQMFRHAPADAGGWQPLLPDELEAMRRAVAGTRWDEQTGLTFRWDQLFVVHEPGVVASTRRLMTEVQRWKNRPIRVRAEWVALDPALVDAIVDGADVGARLDEIRAGSLLPPFELVTRSGTPTELSIAERHAALWGFLGPDRASPEVRLLPRGTSLTVLPRRYGNGRVELDVRFERFTLDVASLAPVAAADGLVSKPRFARAALEQTIAVEDGVPQLLIESSDGQADGKVRALLVTAWH